MDQLQTAPGLDAGQAKTLKIISNSGRATRFLGFFYFVMSLVNAYSFWRLFSLLRANPELNSAAISIGQLTGIPWLALLAFIVMLAQSLLLFFAGTYIQKNLTKDTVLYLRIVLVVTAIAFLMGALSMRISFGLILYAVLLYYVVRGLVAIKKVAIDPVARDPKRVFVFALLAIALVVPLAMQFMF